MSPNGAAHFGQYHQLGAVGVPHTGQLYMVFEAGLVSWLGRQDLTGLGGTGVADAWPSRAGLASKASDSWGFERGSIGVCDADVVANPHSHPEGPTNRHPGQPPAIGGQWHFDPDSYLRMVRSEVPGYDRLQAALAQATVGRNIQSILDLGSGTGVTAEYVLRVHPGAALTGIDSSEEMLGHARRRLPGATFLVSRLEDPLPDGPFDLVVSALAIHHLDARSKADLFRRVASVLSPSGRFAFLDVVTATAPVPQAVPIEPGVDLPSTTSDLLHWLREADLEPQIVVDEGDLVVIAADSQY